MWKMAFLHVAGLDTDGDKVTNRATDLVTESLDGLDTKTVQVYYTYVIKDLSLRPC